MKVYIYCSVIDFLVFSPHAREERIMKKIFKIIIYFIGLWIFATLAKENIYILIFGIGVILWWGLDQLEKKTNENSMNFLIKIESL